MIDEYEIIALAKRLNISIEDMKKMSFVSLLNILISSVYDDTSSSNGIREATAEDIQKYFW